MTVFDPTTFVLLLYCVDLCVSLFAIAFAVQCCKKKKKTKDVKSSVKQPPGDTKSGKTKEGKDKPAVNKSIDKPLLPGADADAKSRTDKTKSVGTAATKSKTEDDAKTAKSKMGEKSGMAKTAIPSALGAGKPPQGPVKPGAPPVPAPPGAPAGPPKPGAPPPSGAKPSTVPGAAPPPTGAAPPPAGATPPPDSTEGIKSKKEDVKSKKEDVKSKKEEPAKPPEAGKGEKGVKSDVGLRSDKAAPDHSDKESSGTEKKEGEATPPIGDEPPKEEDKKGDEGGAEKAEKEEKAEDKEEEKEEKEEKEEE
ncbi:unnamed protein product [Meloidogyne enterolobii]|uniref:Uncharacterized protein n=1 Tax=Meloidogyne enterolobii TaxID=390850 RepID=A0ACB1B8B7_MELEN